jgi:hypothetical protein
MIDPLYRVLVRAPALSVALIFACVVTVAAVIYAISAWLTARREARAAAQDRRHRQTFGAVMELTDAPRAAGFPSKRVS